MLEGLTVGADKLAMRGYGTIAVSPAKPASAETNHVKQIVSQTFKKTELRRGLKFLHRLGHE